MKADFKVRRGGNNGTVIFETSGDALSIYRSFVANRRDFQQDDVLEIWYKGELKMTSNFGDKIT